jgi:hypothetical protein
VSVTVPVSKAAVAVKAAKLFEHYRDVIKIEKGLLFPFPIVIRTSNVLKVSNFYRKDFPGIELVGEFACVRINCAQTWLEVEVSTVES